MRQQEHLGYTPAPDIVHEAAGHAPIVADPDYRRYLRAYGEVARNAIFSKHDIDIYEAIRDLSDIKEDPKSTEQQIADAQARFEKAAASSDHVSEAAQLSRMAWWTIEYGLIGNTKKRLIYGAGLLSSVNESYHCLSDEVAKLPLTVDCVDRGYDITKPQPQLYVTPDFETLTAVLNEFADRMAFRRGGFEALEKAKQAATCTTTVLDSGLQISSTLASIRKDEKGKLAYLQYQGPTQLSFGGHSAKYHLQGFGTPIGSVKLHDGRTIASSKLSKKDLQELGFQSGKSSSLHFASGVEVQGELTGLLEKNGHTLVLRFKNCTVTWKTGGKTETLFQPDWGTFDMACGSEAVSVFGGAADRTPYMHDTGGYKQRPASQKTNRTAANRPLEDLYAQVRAIRESKQVQAQTEKLALIQKELGQKFPQDWLLRLELLELDKKHGLKSPWASDMKKQLDSIARGSKEKAELIQRGLAVWT
jgi:phenylalanine-4-hydroxylase